MLDTYVCKQVRTLDVFSVALIHPFLNIAAVLDISV